MQTTEASVTHAREVDLVWGAEAIAVEINVTTRRAFRLLESGEIPGRKVGRRWVCSRAALAAFFAAVAA